MCIVKIYEAAAAVGTLSFGRKVAPPLRSGEYITYLKRIAFCVSQSINGLPCPSQLGFFNLICAN
ncbi:hypothetical protein HYU06_04650 [Candidatus Woesearchaeota archaeon]|nr:hypothetical protein [Candidatus Woesearchaeota archaeon]